MAPPRHVGPSLDMRLHRARAFLCARAFHRRQRSELNSEGRSGEHAETAMKLASIMNNVSMSERFGDLLRRARHPDRLDRMG